MKRKKSTAAIFAIVAIAIFTGIYYYQRKEVETVLISTNCRKYPCEVNFKVLNKTNDYLACNISIRGLKKFRSRPIGDSASGFAAEKILELKLYPREKRNIIEYLEMKVPYSEIQVLAWNIHEIE